mmetsp:Transcript_29345/g.51403  ORF Transcript_29345/g.51403 Transcript_29345/m.51403 type:complete len:235 (-) Transcript_29345:151-855(-)
MALPTISAHPVNIVSPEQRKQKPATLADVPNCKFKLEDQKMDDESALKSLRLTSDRRFCEIKHYTESASAGHSHLDRLMKNQRASQKIDPEAEGVPNLHPGHNMTFQQLAEMEQNSPDMQQARMRLMGVQDRLAWQEHFDRSVTRLLIDFDLTTAPECRLNHLERMHSWFTEHGGKQQRKDRKAPNYIIADRKGEMPPGSTANLPAKLQDTAQILASSYSKRGNTPRARTPRTR